MHHLWGLGGEFWVFVGHLRPAKVDLAGQC
jgi:hypothetical protein